MVFLQTPAGCGHYTMSIVPHPSENCKRADSPAEPNINEYSPLADSGAASPAFIPLPSGRGQGVGEVRTPPLDKSGTTRCKGAALWQTAGLQAPHSSPSPRGRKKGGGSPHTSP